MKYYSSENRLSVGALRCMKVAESQDKLSSNVPGIKVEQRPQTSVNALSSALRRAQNSAWPCCMWPMPDLQEGLRAKVPRTILRQRSEEGFLGPVRSQP